MPSLLHLFSHVQLCMSTNLYTLLSTLILQGCQPPIYLFIYFSNLNPADSRKIYGLNAAHKNIKNTVNKYIPKQ